MKSASASDRILARKGALGFWACIDIHTYMDDLDGILHWHHSMASLISTFDILLGQDTIR